MLALLIATPVALGIALFISHYAPKRLAQGLGYLVDLLAAIPSVVYGLWGIVFLAAQLTPAYAWLADHLGFIPFFKGPASATGRTMLTVGIVLAVMILPIMTAICREIFLQTPKLYEEAALRSGCHPVGDDPDGGAALWKVRHHQRGHARAGPGAGRDDGGRAGPVRRRRDLAEPDQHRRTPPRSLPTSRCSSPSPRV